MKMKRSLVVIIAVSLTIAGLAQATLIDNGDGTVTDTDFAIMWLKNANLAGTARPWDEAMAWANNLVFAGFDDWRLPTALNQDWSGLCGGFNCTDSEMGHLYYEELANPAGGPPTNTDPFINVQREKVPPGFGRYWLGTELGSPPSVAAWMFGFKNGSQGGNNKNQLAYAWAVRTIPELATPIELEIIGPNEVAENFSTSYKAIAHYEDDSTKDVTDSAEWLVEPNSFASIEAGLLTTEGIDRSEEDITIYAQYTEDEVSAEAEKEVLVFAICPSGSALSFDGVDDWVDFGDITTFDGLSEISFVSWIYTTHHSSTQSIMTKYLGNLNRGFAVFLMSGTSKSKILLIIYNGGSKGHYGYWQTDDEVINDDTWHHIVATANLTSGAGYIYVDGVVKSVSFVQSGNGLPSTTSDVTAKFYIGAREYGGGSNYFDGPIDEVAIYNRALSAEEIRANMRTRLSGDEPGLVGYWDFDEGEEQVAYDLSPYGNHGQLGFTPNADASDPDWIESDAPIGICTLEELVERNLSDVLDIKLDILEQLGIALAKEEAVVDMLKTFFKNRDFGNAKKGNIGKAKKKIHSAIKHEKKSKKELEKSIEKLEDALTTLGQ